MKNITEKIKPAALEHALSAVQSLVDAHGVSVEEALALLKLSFQEEALQLRASPTEIRARHAALEDWWRKASETERRRMGYRVDLAAYRLAVEALQNSKQSSGNKPESHERK